LTAEGTTSKGTGSISCEVQFCIFLQTKSQNFTDKGCTCLIISGLNLLRMRNVTGKKIWSKNKNMNFMFSDFFCQNFCCLTGNVEGKNVRNRRVTDDKRRDLSVG
jgi:hypothetical protein